MSVKQTKMNFFLLVGRSHSFILCMLWDALSYNSFTMRKFEDMSNELLLCIWDQLSFADVIYSFSYISSRIQQLLLEFYKLYKKLNLRYCFLTAFRYFCHQIPMMNEWRLNLTVLKLGNRYRCSQINSFTNEVIKSFIAKYFANQYVNLSKDLFRTIMLSNQRFEPFFPQADHLFMHLRGEHVHNKLIIQKHSLIGYFNFQIISKVLDFKVQ